MSNPFPSMRAPELLRLLCRKPLAYVVVRQDGTSHRDLESPDYPPVRFSFHDNQDLAPGVVKKVLVKDVGLSVKEALTLLR